MNPMRYIVPVVEQCLRPTESLFAENHEPFFNSIGQSRHIERASVAPRLRIRGTSSKDL